MAYKRQERGGGTSGTEVRHLLVAWLALSLAVTLLFADPFRRPEILLSPLMVWVFIGSLFTAGTGFLLHELAHKVVAQRYGYWAEFRADPQMLVIAVVSGAVGFLFAAPGAVRIYSYGNREIKKSESGIISVAGPVTNLLLFGVFLVISLAAGSLGMPILAQVSFFGMFINAFLAAFNMIPFGPLDGRSVMNWNRLVFGIVFVISAALALMTITSFNISQIVR